MALAEDAPELNLEACIGFSGHVLGGLKVTPCGNYTVYPLGKMMIVRSLTGGKTAFLEGHTNDICCVAMSPDGKRLATGQVNHPGVKADVCIWDMSRAVRNCDSHDPHGAGVLLSRFRQHLGKVQCLDFSCDGRYLATLGGQDDNTLVVWDIDTGRAICGAPAAQDSALAIKWLNRRNDRLVTAGNYNLRVWQVDVRIPKIHAVDAKMGTVRRIISCVAIAADDSHAVCGTRTGDLLRFTIDRDGIQSCNEPDTVRPTLSECSREKFGRGVRALACVLNAATGATNCLVAAGDGTVAFVNPALNRVRERACELLGGCTSVALCPDGKGFFAGTELSNRYWVSMNMEVELRGTCHHGRVNDVVFPKGCPSLFVTCSVQDIRVWNAKQRQELLRIQVPNLECSCVGITHTGSTIVSGWSDGKLRAFYPESGKLKFVITDAHAEGVTALALAHDDDARPPWRVISGGADGRVRVWSVTPSHQAMAISWKEHRGPVTCIKVSGDNRHCVTSSEDGSCIVWDLERGVRSQAMFEPTVFKSVAYHPDESQYLTCGSNHKITYWDAYDGSAIREIDGGEEGMNALDVDRNGCCFVSGGDDSLIKVWHYDDGIAMAVGHGHSGKVNSVRVSPDGSSIVSVGEEGGIFIWRMPEAAV
ncbi:flagellar associated protein putative: flagellar associated protein [Tribonema minus]|uniref:Cilia- and flagella-associated protein 52 n=1 Tax=Tribonema minus TaxID=303371 RepID=A0A835Z6M8_9STRA|nr:flagellar associated protein putative: flagellar associated protein [Tribonema minus]